MVVVTSLRRGESNKTAKLFSLLMTQYLFDYPLQVTN